MKLLLILSCLCALYACSGLATKQANPIDFEQINKQKHRLIVLADMGNEEDEMQQMMHLLMYANEIDIEGLIAVSGKFLHQGRHEGRHYKNELHPELLHELVDGYKKVLPKLKQHADGWPEAEQLRKKIKSGTPEYGIAAVGDGKSNEGSNWILKVLERKDDRPVYIVANAGTNVLAQALTDYERRHTKAELDALISKIIVYENGSQDDAGAWIVARYPKLHWIRSNYQTYGYMGFRRINPGPYVWPPYPNTHQGQHAWAKEHIQTHHGALGALYPDRFKGNGFLEGGGTTPWLGLITRGLYDPYKPNWGGWSGRYTAKKMLNVWSRHKDIIVNEITYKNFSVFADEKDTWTHQPSGVTYSDILTPIQRWREDILNDFKGRMDWCVETRENANHNPVAVINGIDKRVILRTKARTGETLTFDASDSFDPDKGQKINFSWWVYPESGTYYKYIALKNPHTARLKFPVPKDAGGKQIHLILEVSDNSDIATMKDYRRIVIDVE